MKILLILLIVLGLGIGEQVFATAGDSTNSDIKNNHQESIEIKINQTIEFEDLEIKFIKIEDSRCPSDVTCVWEGEAKTTFQIKQQLNLQTITLSTQNISTTSVKPYEFSLTNIMPYPITTKDLSDEYVAIINITKNNLEIHPAPIKQIKNGIELIDIKCNEGKKTAYKYNLSRIVCVSNVVFDKLVERGWALSKNEQNKLDISSLSENTFWQNQKNNSKFNVTPKIIDGQSFLIFNGSGWNFSHEVEIAILDNTKITKIIKTRTNNNGEFYVSWSLPNDFQSGQYKVEIEDGIHQKTEKVTISGVSNEIRHIGSGFEVIVEGDKQVRRGTTHSIDVNVYRDKIPVEGARVFLTIEDYGEDIIREFKGRTDKNGYFNYSWEIPKSFDDIETLLAFVGVTDGNSSKTKLFKFVVYCLPEEKGCKADGN